LHTTRIGGPRVCFGSKGFLPLADEHDVDEKRREHRFQPNQTVTLKVLGMRPGPVMTASVGDISGSGMRLRTSLPVPCGTSIEIETQEMLALGSVCRCEPDNGSYTIGVQISETGAPPRT
jgi:PilZ domain-containing protein